MIDFNQKRLKEKTDREERLDDQLTEWKSKLERMNFEFIELNQRFDKFSLTDKEKDKNGLVTSLLIWTQRWTI